MTTKLCRACGKEKPLADYYSHAGRGRADGLDTVCKICKKNKTAARRSGLRSVGFCQDCGGLSGGKKFCPACNERRNEQHRQKRALVVKDRKKSCPFCGTTFENVRSDAVYCSTACRKKAGRLRRANDGYSVENCLITPNKAEA